MLLFFIFLLLFSSKNGWSWKKRKVIKTHLKINHCISQLHEQSCALFILKKYFWKHLELSIFLCSLGAVEGTSSSWRKKPGESNPVPSAVRVNIASYYRHGWWEGQDFLLSPSEKQFPSALSFNFKVEFVLSCRLISTLGAWLVGA